MKLPALVLLAAFAAGWPAAAGVRPRRNSPSGRSDTVVRCGAVPCDLSYRFLTIANADRSEALAAIENANVNYFFALEDFTGTAEEAARRFIERFAADNACDTLYMPDMRYSLSVAAAQAPVDTAHGLHDPPRELYGRCARYAHDRVPQLLDEGRLRTLARRPLSGGAASPAHRADQGEAPRAQYGAADDEELAQRGFFPETIAPTENFEVTPEGIVFHYNPYDIACYAIGEVDVPFTKEELK